MKRRLRKAVIPAAGFGTRFLPFTKAVPKELIPLVDRPVIQYVVEEAAAAGFDEILIVLSTEKEAVIRHFNPAPELERRLAERGKSEILDELRAVERLARVHYVFQPELNGLGGAVALARTFAGGEPFAVLLGDTVMYSESGVPAIGQLAEVYEREAASVVALEPVPAEAVRKYGVVGGAEVRPGVIRVNELVEKPAPEAAPSNLAVAARYILEPEIFDALERTPRGRDNELQLTDAMKLLLAVRPMFGRVVEASRYDIGSKLGFLKGTVEFGLRRPEFRAEFLKFIKEIAAEN